MADSELKAAVERSFADFSNYYGKIPCGGDVFRKRESKNLDVKPSGISTNQSRVKIFKDCFKPIQSSPKTGGAFRACYVCADNVNASDEIDPDSFFIPSGIGHQNRVVNSIGVDQQKIAEQLSQRAQALREDPTNPFEAIILVGSRGVGKTAWINSLFSCYHTVFDEHKVIFIRISLTNSEAIEKSLADLIDTKTYRILYDHYMTTDATYIKERDFYDISDYVHVMKEKDKRSRVFSLEAFRTFLRESNRIGLNLKIETIVNSSDEEILSARSNEPLKLRARLFHYFANAQGYAFIYVVDGLDESVMPIIKKDKLGEWHEAIEKLLEGKSNFPEGLYILCGRTESFLSFAEKHCGVSRVFPSAKVQRVMHVRSVPIRMVLDKRVAWIKERTKKENNIWSLSWSPETVDVLYGLVLYAFNAALHPTGLTIDQFLDALSDPGHIRSFLTFFRDAIWETIAILDEHNIDESRTDTWFKMIIDSDTDKSNNVGSLVYFGLCSAILKKAYRIWSLASLNYGGLLDVLLDTFSYGFSGNPDVYGETAEGDDLLLLVERPIIPIAWGDIKCPISGKELNEHLHHHLLLKMHIFQYIEQNETRSAVVSGEAIKQDISQCLHYDPMCIDKHLRAMLIQGLIDVSESSFILDGFEKVTFRTTKLGKLVMTKWILVPEYIEHTMHYAGVPQCLKGEFPRFEIGRSKGPLSNVKALNTAQYLAKLLPAMQHFVSLVACIEHWIEGMRTFLEHDRRRDKLPPISFKPRYIAKELAMKVRERALKIVTSAEGKEQHDIIEALSEIYLP